MASISCSSGVIPENIASWSPILSWIASWQSSAPAGVSLAVRERDPSQYRHLVDDEKNSLVERKYGTIRRRVVLYRGEDAILDIGVEYRNVEAYLKGLGQSHPSAFSASSK